MERSPTTTLERPADEPRLLADLLAEWREGYGQAEPAEIRHDLTD